MDNDAADAEIAVALLRRNKSAVVNIRDKDGRTALHFAARPDKENIIEVLLRGTRW